jgi:hypothetical protein
MARVKLRLTLIAALLLVLSLPALGQVIPRPGAGHDLFIRDRNGKVIERLVPDGDHYDVFDAQHDFIPLGRADMMGQRLVITDRNGHVLATARPELLPPDSALDDITVVRSAAGKPIGTLGRRY